MDKNKKTRLVVRVLCAILAVIMTLSVIIPVAYATEIENGNEAPYLNGEGFEYVEMDGEWYLNATSDNPVFRLTNIAESFTRDNFPIVICNVDTYEVTSINLLELHGFAGSCELAPGYYFIIGNNYAWADADGRNWAINNGENFFFYCGAAENFRQGKHDLQYVAFEKIVDIPLHVYGANDLHVIPSTQTYHLDEADKAYPMDELHNIDEILERLEYLDLEASLDVGHPVYTEGYEPNTITGANMESGYSVLEQNIIDNLTAFSQINGPIYTAQNVTNTPPVEDVNNATAMNNETIPVAQPEIIESTPLLPNGNNESPTENVSPEHNETNQNIPPNALEIATDVLNDKTGIDVTPVGPTPLKNILFNILKSALFFGCLSGVALFFYIKEKRKQQEQEQESIEFDFYDEGRIE